MKNQSAFVSPLLSPKDAAALTTMFKPLLRALEREQKFPAARHFSERRIAYSRREVEEWIAAHLGIPPKHRMIIGEVSA